MSSRLQPAVPCLDDPDRVSFTTMTSHAVVANSDMIRGNLLLIGYLSLGLLPASPFSDRAVCWIKLALRTHGRSEWCHCGRSPEDSHWVLGTGC
jgi:hypothetical protein